MGNQNLKQKYPLRAESLFTKIHRGNQTDILKYLKEENIELNKPINNMGDTICHYASYNSYYSVLNYLISKKADFNVTNTRGLTPIDVALPPVRQWIYEQLVIMKKLN